MLRHLRFALIGLCFLAVPAFAQFMDYLTFSTFTLSNSIQTVSAFSGPFLGYNCYNPNTAIVYVQIFDAAGGVVVGTTVPNKVIQLAGNSPTGLQVPSPPFSAVTGLQVAATTTQGGSGAPSVPVACEFYFR